MHSSNVVEENEANIAAFTDGYLDMPFLISDEIKRRASDVLKLERLTNVLRQLPEERIKREQSKLIAAINSASGFTKRIIEHAQILHAEYVETMMDLASREGGITKAGYSNYLLQGWYHTRYTPRFEHLFTDALKAIFMANPALGGLLGIDDKDNKFAKLAVHDIDEEEGHELWALLDIAQINELKSVDVMRDIYPETKAIVWSQHDRLARLPAIGFLGYSFYLEFLIASHSLVLCDAIRSEFGSEREDNRFIYFHYLVDQGHSVDNLQLFDRLVRSEQDVKEVIDNMNFIHAMYKGLTVRAFAQD